MSEQAKVVAVLVANPALSSILSMVLASVPTLRVRPFESETALTTYMRLAPVDLLVCDFDSRNAPADRVAEALRRDKTLTRRSFQVIALASEVTAQTKRVSISAGIDEIIVKPMSPKYLLERVLSRLQRRAASSPRASTRAVPRDLSLAGSNVIPLFGHRLQTLH
jgi:two-component system, OmpR family, phosphate regulon response regulator PhoB